MNKDLSLCAPGDDVRDALKTGAQRQLHRLPVVGKDGALKGIPSLKDIVLRAETNGLSNDLLKTMKAICDRQNQRPVSSGGARQLGAHEKTNIRAARNTLRGALAFFSTSS